MAPEEVLAPPAGWPRDTSPYHAGESALQTLAGVRDRAERQGRRMIRDEMPDQHRELFEKLPYLLMGSLDAEGRPWATMLAGPSGFVRSPDARTLQIGALPTPISPVASGLVVGAPVGLLGIELATRRRNRANGHLTAVATGSLGVAVDQSFGNCPQYIQARAPEPTVVDTEASALSAETAALSPRARTLVATADTVFIASASADPWSDDPVEGVDVSHRGGRPGFVHVGTEAGRTVLLAPDFRGNSAFNTFGNLAVNPRAGLLVPDFADGTLLALTGEAEVLWDHPAIARFAGAQRLLRFRVDSGVLAERAMPFRWSAPEPAPQLARTGAWADLR